MNEELDKQLCEKYPKIFKMRNASMQETCMCWGFEHGDGWFDIIDAACKNNVQIFGVGQHKGSPYERMLHPRATKLLDMHSHGQLSDADAFKHEKQNPVKRT